MTEPAKISPEALAMISRPKGVVAYPYVDREAWLGHRKADVTASVAAALFGDGVHTFTTAYALWALKAGVVTEDPEEKPAMKRGRMFEPVVVELIREANPTWIVSPNQTYFSDPAHRIGATPDAFVIQPDREGFGVIQIKTAGAWAFKTNWTNADGDIEVPLWVAVQANVEAALTGASYAYVSVLDLGDDELPTPVIEVPLKPALLVKLRELIADFWRRVDQNDPYPPNFNKDGALIAKIYRDADEDNVADLSGNNRIAELLDVREGLKATEKAGADSEKRRKAIDIEIIFALGNAARGRLADGRVVEAPTTRRGGYAVNPTSFRSVRIKGNGQLNHNVTGTKPASDAGRKLAAGAHDFGTAF